MRMLYFVSFILLLRNNVFVELAMLIVGELLYQPLQKINPKIIVNGLTVSKQSDIACIIFF